jgi:hypothetical protein
MVMCVSYTAIMCSMKIQPVPVKVDKNLSIQDYTWISVGAFVQGRRLLGGWIPVDES